MQKPSRRPAACGRRGAFNSLFEMPDSTDRFTTYSAERPFNSLFEMHRLEQPPKSRAEEEQAFNSLFEMPL